MGKTICAISTPLIKSGIAIIRISGNDSLDVLTRLTGKTFSPRLMTLCKISASELKDKALCVYFKAPNSYTGEDMAEIQCHGSVVVASAILNACIALGCGMAEPGEFTKRAFLNGKMDLAEAEGVIDLIEAEGTAAAKAAFALSEGGVSKAIFSIQDELINLISAAEVTLDYPEEGVEVQEKSALKSGLKVLADRLDELQKTFSGGRMQKNGVRVAIVGRPNVGKSQLLNALTESERAIVTDIAGTTRDTVEEAYEFRGVKFIIVDTAGIRQAVDEVEKLGIERSRKAILQSDIVINLLDESEASDPFIEKELLNSVGKTALTVINKVDKLNKTALDKNKFYISAKNGDNIIKLKETLFNLTVKNVSNNGVVLTNSRHYAAVIQALNSLSSALNGMDTTSMDCILSDLNSAFRALGAVTGATASDEIITRIFQRFCVGK